MAEAVWSRTEFMGLLGRFMASDAFSKIRWTLPPSFQWHGDQTAGDVFLDDGAGNMCSAVWTAEAVVCAFFDHESERSVHALAEWPEQWPDPRTHVAGCPEALLPMLQQAEKRFAEADGNATAGLWGDAETLYASESVDDLEEHGLELLSHLHDDEGFRESLLEDADLGEEIAQVAVDVMSRGWPHGTTLTAEERSVIAENSKKPGWNPDLDSFRECLAHLRIAWE